VDAAINGLSYDVIIVGAGPAGASCAFFLARNGLKVLVLEKDRFPREKVCGDCLTPTGVELTRELEVYPELLKKGVPIKGVRIITGTNTVNTTLFKTAGLTNGLVVKRFDLDHLLLKNAEKAGAEIRENAEVVDVTSEADFSCTVKYIAGGKTYVEKSRYAVIACGGGTPLLSKSIKIAYDCYRAVGVAVRGYFELKGSAGEFMELLAQPEHWPALGWIFPAGSNLVNAGIGFYLSEKRKIRDRTLSKAMQTFIQRGWHSSRTLKNASLLGQVKARRLCMGGIKRKPVINNIFLIGEAAGLVNPFTGEGIAHAMLSGKLAGISIFEAIEKGRDFDFAANAYVSRLQEELLSYYKTAIFLRNFAKSWTFTDILVRILNRSPSLSALNIKYWVKA
jgi:geranylgeranyl reductase family protein